METSKATQPPSCSSSQAIAYPSWVLLSQCGERQALSSADAKTLATARTSTGHLIGASLRLAAPPAVSHLCMHFPPNLRTTFGIVFAAHGDSFIISVSFRDTRWYSDDDINDSFLYTAGSANPATAVTAPPRRLPSLSLLPPYYLSMQESAKYSRWRRRVRHPIDTTCTGLLRQGEDEFVVAELMIVKVEMADNMPAQNLAKLLLFHSGKWSVKLPSISCCDIEHGELLNSWNTCSVLPIGDTKLCWVDLCRGLLFCNVLDENPVLQYMSLPTEAAEPLHGPGSSRQVCVTRGGAVKLVNVVPRCCCGGAGSTHCQRSHNAYIINTWTLRMDDMLWVMDAMVDATELWSLDAYKGIPRSPLLCPIVTMDDPHVNCFLVCPWFHVKGHDTDKTGWLILVDTREKAILSVYSQSDGLRLHENILPSMVSYYLNSNPCRGKYESSVRKGHMDMIPSPVLGVEELVPNDVGDSVWPSSMMSTVPDMQLSAILTVFEEIASYGLDPDDILKACRILRQSNGRRFRSILGIPNSLRKNWLLMEIKATVDM